MKRSNKGFTLIELLVVVLIIGILASFAVSHYRYASAKAKFTQLKVAATAIWDAQRRYKLFTGEKRTLDLSALDVQIDGCKYNSTGDKISCAWGGCSIAHDSNRRLMSCSLSNPQVSYYVNLVGNSKHCCASKQSGEIGKKLCKELFPKSGEGNGDSWCGTGGTLYSGY